MRNLSKLILVFGFWVLLNLGCSNSAKPTISPTVLAEARVRQDFASNISANYPYRVVFSAQGENKEILDITVIEEVSAYAASGVVDMIITEKLRKDAKDLKFTKIVIEGGRKSFGAKDTINKTIYLQ